MCLAAGRSGRPVTHLEAATPFSWVMALSPTRPVALEALQYHRGLPQGLRSSRWDLAGVGAGHSLSPQLPKLLPSWTLW